MKRFPIAGALLGFAFAMTVHAQDTSSVAVQAGDDTSTPALAAADATLRDQPSDRNCLRETGSAITARRNARSAKADQKCVSASGRSYSREDLDSTGEIDIADALRKLDPAIR